MIVDVEYSLTEFVDTGKCTPRPVSYVARIQRRHAPIGKPLDELLEEIERERSLYITDEDGTTYVLIGERG